MVIKYKMQPQSFHMYSSSTKLKTEVLNNSTLVFDVEETLLKSSSMFPYFMLVAFEGGGILRALILLLLYPILCLLGQGMSLKIMVFICFFGVDSKTFRLGKSCLPKLFLENVGEEEFEMVMRFEKKVAISRLPRVMVEGYLRDYLGFEEVLGGEIVEFGGYYLGLLQDMGVDKKKGVIPNFDHVVGIGGYTTPFKTWPFMFCKDIYLVNKDNKKWRNLPKDKYPKPLIFHDSRIAFEPTPLNTLVMFIWLPFGIILCITRVIFGTLPLLPYKVSSPIFSFLGANHMSSSHAHTHTGKTNGLLYVSNHKTILDPICLSQILQTSVPTVSYSISKTIAAISPIRTLNLTRDRAKDAEIMLNALSKGDLVVCPEGTTCREPYLLRFSPLFAELTDEIIPMAIECKVSMFHGTTTTGYKALDPFFVMLNPKPWFYVKFLDKLPKNRTCKGGGLSRLEVANYIQAEIGKALGYKCSNLTRKDKYEILAGNDGLVK